MKKQKLKLMLWNLDRVPYFVKRDIAEVIDGFEPGDELVNDIIRHRKDIEKHWPEELRKFVMKKVVEAAS